MRIILDIKNTENFDVRNQRKYEEIVSALISSGGLDGVKGGQTIIHFDSEANFMGVQLSYWPFKRRKT